MGTQSTWGQHSYCVSTKTHYTYTQNMLRFVIGALLLSTTVLGAVQPRVQPNARQFEPQQSELGEWKTVEPQQTEFGEWKIEPQLSKSCEMTKNCPVKCVVSDWSECETGNSLDCEPGTKTRTVITQANYGGLECPSLTQSCEMSKKCPAVNCAVSDWSECKTGNLLDCGPGTKTRTVITQASYGGLECPKNVQSTVLYQNGLNAKLRTHGIVEQVPKQE